jgi:anti-sigma28 factor (negative regulator of flagellin synthesis)
MEYERMTLKQPGHNMLKKLPIPLNVDGHRINIIRTKLDEDAYVVNSRQIADKIIDIEIALSTPRRQSTN